MTMTIEEARVVLNKQGFKTAINDGELEYSRDRFWGDFVGTEISELNQKKLVDWAEKTIWLIKRDFEKFGTKLGGLSI